MKRNSTFIDLQNLSQTEFLSSQKRQPIHYIYDIDDAYTYNHRNLKIPQRDILRRIAIENSRKIKLNALKDATGTNLSLQQYKIYTFKEHINLRRSPVPSNNTTKVSIAIVTLTVMLGVILYAINTTHSENTKNIILNKLKMGG